jgi:hypothetical protein
MRAAGLKWKLRRQHPIGRHIVDFACPQCKLAIELDGGQLAAGVGGIPHLTLPSRPPAGAERETASPMQRRR